MRDGLVLNTWELMPLLLARLECGSVQAFFEVQHGALVITEGRRHGKSGIVRLWVNWPRNPNGPVNGILIITHPAWVTLPRILLLVGTGDEDDRAWRFMCPIKRTLHHAVFFDPANHLFVSREAIGKRQRESDFRQIERSLTEILKLECGLANPEPKRMNRRAFAILQETIADVIDNEYLDFVLATNGIVAPVLDENGYPDVLAMSKQSDPSRQLQQRTLPWRSRRQRRSRRFAANMGNGVKAKLGCVKGPRG